MLVRYKHMNFKPDGVFLVIPFAARKSHSLSLKAKKVHLAPFGELPDADALAYCKADPHNFEIVKEGDAVETEPLNVSDEGLELDGDPVPVKKKPGRKPKIKTEEAA